MGDVVHSRPHVVHYGTDTADPSDDASYIFASTNGGVMHCIKDSDGNENWGFMPGNHLNRLNRLIDDDKTLNAFCTPGGFIYVYTGLIKFLDSEDQLAGVMGHEIAHAALRHSTRQMTKVYGVQTLLQVATGRADPGGVHRAR